LSFEIRQKDLLGRIGKLSTRHGVLETPLLLPVVNPNNQLIPSQQLHDTFGFDALITNSYLVWRNYRDEKIVPKIHEILKFDGVVETDSGAYQILQYGDVEVQPAEIIRFQEQLDSDIAVILDIPTGDEASQQRARWTVDETLRRADQARSVITRNDILWVGPIQGGMYPELVAYSAREMTKRDFAIYALGSPTPVMQQYRFDELVDMIMAAKLNLRPDRPLHLFGGGHPMMFALAVALGCDIFDSASYALFARNGRYMTSQGTSKIQDLEYFPCNCPICHRKTPEDIRRLLPADRERFLASHNLHSCFTELQTIKQAIIDGRLWELVESRSRNHPALQRGFQKLLHYAEALERETPVRKKKGPFIISSDSLGRPEVLRFQGRLLHRYEPPHVKTAFLLPEDMLRPFRDESNEDNWVQRIEKRNDFHMCAYGLSFSIIPSELLDVYPLSQTEQAVTPSATAISRAVSKIGSYMATANYANCVIVTVEAWQLRLAKALRAKVKGKIKFKIIQVKHGEKPFSELFKLARKRSRSKRIT